MGGIRSGLRLGQRKGGQRLPGGERRQPATLLLLAPEVQDRLGPNRAMNVENAGGTGSEAGDLLDEDRKGDVVQAGAAIRFGYQHPHQAQLGGFVDEIPWELVVMIDGLRAGLDLAQGKVMDELADVFLLGAEREIHYFTRTMVASPWAIPEQMPAAP